MSRSLLIVEEALRSLDHGHWPQYIGTIARGCRAAGAEVTIAAHRAATPELLADLGAEPVLRYSAWDNIYYSSNPLARYVGVLRHNWRLFRDVSAFLRRQNRRYDVLLAPTNLVHHVLGWRWVAGRHAGRHFDKLILIFVNTPGSLQPSGELVFPRSAEALRRMLRSLAPLHRAGRVVLAAETRRAGEQFQRFSGLDFALMPHPVDAAEIALPSETASAERSHLFASFGFARHEKGSDLLQTALRRLLDANELPGIRFLLQWKDDFLDERGGWVRPDPVLLRHPRVEFLNRGLKAAEYLERLAQTDALVLPYRRQAYHDRVSRAAIEAACAGVPMLYPRDCWLADLVSQCGAGVGFTSGDSEDLLRALRELAGNLAFHRQAARDRVAAARAYFAPRRFHECLFGGAAAGVAGDWF